jgi:hypothetical protein
MKVRTLVNKGLAYFAPLMLLVYRIVLVAVREDLETPLVDLRISVGAWKIGHACNSSSSGTNLDQRRLLHIHVDAGNNQHCK